MNIVFFRNVCFLTFFSLLSVKALEGQVEYPPETHAISIPKMDDIPLADGPFKPSVDSLLNFKSPDWFRDGKFGIWAHWGPQAVPGDGDWFARNMYEEGSYPYQDHVKVYGHPSKMGYKDIVTLWKAEKWDPDRLMSLYKAAGAHYFVAQAVHHDNFDNWNSQYHKWNSVNMGPHKDIVGLWQQAAKKQGLPFGFSEHLGHSFTFMQTSHGADKNGPLAGVPYDGADSKYWDLYQFPANPGDDGWYCKDPRWAQEWYARIHDVVTKYKPDLLYSDGGIPYGEAGLRVVSQLYNLSVQQNGGTLQAVYCSKKNYAGTDYFDGIGVQDLERGQMDEIQPFAWQTDTSTGDWYYNRNDHYRSSEEIIHTLMDIVSKNGNLLLNVVLYPDGSLPPPMEVFLKDMAAWMKVNGEAVFNTRPWTIYGEGSTKVKGGSFSEGTVFTGKDIRFTRHGDDIYVTTLGLPEGQVVVRSLASDSPLVTGDPTSVTLLGSPDSLKWSRTTDGLNITLPDILPCKAALCFKVSGLKTINNLTHDQIMTFRNKIQVVTIAAPSADGSIQLVADDAQMNGATVRVEGDGNKANVGWWQNSDDSISWKMKVAKAGSYKIVCNMASETQTQFAIQVGAQKIACAVPATGDYKQYQDVQLGNIQLEAGISTLNIIPKSASTWNPINVRTVKLVPAE